MRKRFLIFLIIFLSVAILLLSLFFLNFNSIKSESDSTGDKWTNLIDYFKFVKTSPPIDELSVPSYPTEESGSGGPIVMESTTGLEENQVYIRNDNSFDLQNHLFSIPISFAPCEYTEGQNNVRLKNIVTQEVLDTQIHVTGYYQKTGPSCSKGSVMFAVAHIQTDLAIGEEKIFEIIRSSQEMQAFNYASEVQNFFNSGEMKTVSKDIFGRDYAVNIPLGSLDLIENGPIVKIFKYEKMNDQISGLACSGSQPCLDHLFSTITYLTIINEEPIIRTQVQVVNSMNLNELTLDCSNPDPYCVYRRPGNTQPVWQNGDLKYGSLRTEIKSNNNQNPLTFYFPDLDINKPMSI